MRVEGVKHPHAIEEGKNLGVLHVTIGRSKGFLVCAVTIGAIWLSACDRDQDTKEQTAQEPVRAHASGISTTRDCDGTQTYLAPPSTVWDGRATAVIDGDSICLGEVEVRVAGISAPEWDEEGGSEAREEMRRILLWANSQGGLRCTSVGRSYDRVVADCTLLNGDDIGELMIEAGAAEPYQKR